MNDTSTTTDSTSADVPSTDAVPRSRLLPILVVGVLLGGGVLAAVRYGGEFLLTEPPDEPDLTAIAAGESLGAEHTAVVSTVTEWPNLFGPAHDSVAPSGSPPVKPWNEEGPTEVWRIDCGTGYSSPVLFGDRLVLQHRLGDEEVVTCMQADDATTIWEHRYPTTFECDSHYTHGPYATPATDGEHVYTIGAQGQLFCLNAEQGDVVWQRNLVEEFGATHEVFGFGASPLIWNDKLILNVGGTEPESGVVALDKLTGETRWRATDHVGQTYATPQPARIHGADYVFVLTAVGLVSLDPDDGHVHWELPYATTIPENYNAITPVVHGDLLFQSVFGQGCMTLRILQDGGYEKVWESDRTLTSHYTPIVCVDGLLYGVHTNDKSLRCVDLPTGEVRWRWRSPLARSTQVAVGEHLVVVGEKSKLGLVDLDPEDFVERALTDDPLFASESLYSAPAYAHGRLYVRGEKQAVCLELSK